MTDQDSSKKLGTADIVRVMKLLPHRYPFLMVDKIIEGRMNKFYEEICLMEQPFIKENTTTIADVVKAKIAKLGENITVSRFVRFKVGDSQAETAPAE